MRVSLPGLSVVHLRRRGSVLAVLAGVSILLELAAGTGLAYIAGWSQMRAALGDFNGIWLLALIGALLISFVGYHYAYRGIFRVEGGPVLPRRQMRAVVAAGFGGFLAHGGGALDQYALQAAGAGENEAKTRVAALGGLEHGVLAIGGCAAAIAVLVSGRGQPPMDRGAVDGRRSLPQGYRCLARLLPAARIPGAFVGEGGGLGLVGHAARAGVGPAGLGRAGAGHPGVAAVVLLLLRRHRGRDRRAGGAGVPVVRTGHPPHALGGEVKVLDPAGNTVLLGQRERPASRAPAGDEGLIRFSILAEAAALVSARGGALQACQVTGRDGGRCPDQAGVKLADSLGDSVWACLPHAEDILVTVPAACLLGSV